MVNNERLTKRVKKIEDWVAEENEEMGGPKGIYGHYGSIVLQGNNASLSNQVEDKLRQFKFQQLRRPYALSSSERK